MLTHDKTVLLACIKVFLFCYLLPLLCMPIILFYEMFSFSFIGEMLFSEMLTLDKSFFIDNSVVK